MRGLIRAGVPNVLGWDGSVLDVDATDFARVLYGELAQHLSTPAATAMARRELLRANQSAPERGRHWHLARLYVGPAGAGKCCDRGRARRRLRKDAGHKEFLDKAGERVPVATAREFVGRRRQAQDVLAAFRANRAPGALIFGMGNLGKSSLAARVANRLPGHKTVVVFERYDAAAIFAQLVAALPPRERSAWQDAWADAILRDGDQLAPALEEMLEGPLDEQPILLIIDDLEQILAQPAPDQQLTPVKEGAGAPAVWRQSLGAILRAFAVARTDSHLLLTSRYDFTLPDAGGRDLAGPLARVQLPAMDASEQAKQWRAAVRDYTVNQGQVVDPALVPRRIGCCRRQSRPARDSLPANSAWRGGLGHTGHRRGGAVARFRGGAHGGECSPGILPAGCVHRLSGCLVPGTAHATPGRNLLL